MIFGTLHCSQLKFPSLLAAPKKNTEANIFQRFMVSVR